MANTKYVGNDGLLEFGQKFLEKLKTLFGYTSGSTLMTPEDKEKLDSIDTGATAVTVDSSLSSTSTNPVQNKVINSALAGKVNTESGKGLSTNDFTTAEKNKLAGIASGATAVTVDSALSTTSTNPVQNKVINSALAGKVDTVSGKGLSTNDYTTADKNKLSGITAGAEPNVVKSVDTTAGTSGINLSTDSNGKLDVTISSGSIANNNANFVTGGTVYSTTSTLAPKSSPEFTGIPIAPTATASTSTTQIATTKFVHDAISADLANAGIASDEVVEAMGNRISALEDTAVTNVAYDTTNKKLTKTVDGTTSDVVTAANIVTDGGGATLASPTFTGTPKAPTATAGTNNTQIATTAFVGTAVSNAVSGLGNVLVYKGTKATYANLPTTGNKAGDVWNVTAAYPDGNIPAGTNWAWSGTEWDALGGSFSVDAYMTNSEVDTLVNNIFA